MPIHFEDRDVAAEMTGLSSALIVPCTMCPAATVAVRENEPFLQLFRSWLKSAPFERHIRALQSRLEEAGARTNVFRSSLYHHWFLCMWTDGRRRKLKKFAKDYDAVIVLGCTSATETVCDAVDSTDCRVIEGMEATGIMNAKLRFHWTGNISFEDCRITPLVQQRKENGAPS